MVRALSFFVLAVAVAAVFAGTSFAAERKAIFKVQGLT